MHVLLLNSLLKRLSEERLSSLRRTRSRVQLLIPECLNEEDVDALDIAPSSETHYNGDSKTGDKNKKTNKKTHLINHLNNRLRGTGGG